MYGEEFWDAISSVPEVDAIVCEATNIERSKKDSEPEWKIEEKFEKLFKENKYNSVFVSSTNIDRLFGIYRAAMASDRIVLMDEYQFDILKSVIGKNDWMRNEQDGIELIDEDGSSRFDTLDPGYEFDKGLPIVLIHDKKVKDAARFYIPEKLRRLINWKGCVLIARTTPIFQSLIESFPKEKSKKYLSQWKGYVNPELPAYNDSLGRILGEDYEYVHTSGHADIDTLRTLFEQIGAGTIIPIHTSNPEKFMETFGEEWPIKLLCDGEPFSISND